MDGWIGWGEDNGFQTLKLLTSTLAPRLPQTPECNTVPLPLLLLRQPQFIPIESLLVSHRRIPIVSRRKMVQRLMQTQTRRIDVRQPRLRRQRVGLRIGVWFS